MGNDRSFRRVLDIVVGLVSAFWVVFVIPLLYALLTVLFLFLALPAFADTVPAIDATGIPPRDIRWRDTSNFGLVASTAQSIGESGCPLFGTWVYESIRQANVGQVYFNCRNTANGSVVEKFGAFRECLGTDGSSWFNVSDSNTHPSCSSSYKTCPPGGYVLDPNGTTCSRQDCDLGHASDGSCTCLPNGTTVGKPGQYLAFNGQSTTGCYNGCRYSAANYTQSRKGSTWQTVLEGPFKADGGACSPNTSATQNPDSQDPTQAPQPACKPPQVQGEVNGQPYCYTPSDAVSVTQNTTTQTKTNPDGSTSTTTSTTTNTTNINGGSASTTSSTTSTTTNKDASGNTTGQSTEQKLEEQKDPCTVNPALPQCKKSSFGGACGGFTCDGDAVQCAIAREQHIRNCTLFETQTPMSTLGTAITSGSDPLASSLPSPQNATEVNIPSTLGASNPFGSSCASDKTFNVLGHSVVIPFSQVCDFARFMGYALVACSYVWALFIVGRVI